MPPPVRIPLNAARILFTDFTLQLRMCNTYDVVNIRQSQNYTASFLNYLGTTSPDPMPS
jgi:hypothetical protein